MSRLAIIAVSLGALPWSGESFVYNYNIATATSTTKNNNNEFPHTSGSSECRRTTHGGLFKGGPKADLPYCSSFYSLALSSITSFRRSSAHKAALVSDLASSASCGGEGRSTIEADGKCWRRRVLVKAAGDILS